MTRIRKILINRDNIPAAGQVRTLTIEGDVGAKVNLQISSSANSFYSFDTQVFAGRLPNVFSANNSLDLNLNSGLNSVNISFPGATGISYFIILTPAANSNTIIPKHLVITRLDTVSDSIVTLAASTASSSKYTTSPAFANINLTGSPFGNTKKILSVDKTVTNATTDANSNGLFITRPNINEQDFFYDTTEVIVSNPLGDGVLSTKVIVADLSELIVGMTLFYHKGTTAPTAGTTIQSIDTATKTITFNKPIAFENSETMTFRAIGLKQINKSLNCVIALDKVSVKSQQKNLNVTPVVKEVSTTVRVAPSNSTTIAVAATQGIPGGSTAVFNGFKVNNSSTNNVNSVTPDPSGGDSDGAITCDVAQTLFAGTKLTFKAANKNHFLTTEAAIKIDLAVLKFPLSSKTINLNLDNFITPGTAS